MNYNYVRQYVLKSNWREKLNHWLLRPEKKKKEKKEGNNNLGIG